MGLAGRREEWKLGMMSNQEAEEEPDQCRPCPETALATGRKEGRSSVGRALRLVCIVLYYHSARRS
jgi:hypothetical protein